jgi:hypothetical protein
MKPLICDQEPEVFRKEWARRDLREAAASCVRTSRSCSVNQIVGMERRSRTYGLSEEETRAAIHEGIAKVPNQHLDRYKVTELTKQFPISMRK